MCVSCVSVRCEHRMYAVSMCINCTYVGGREVVCKLCVCELFVCELCEHMYAVSMCIVCGRRGVVSYQTSTLWSLGSRLSGEFCVCKLCLCEC